MSLTLVHNAELVTERASALTDREAERAVIGAILLDGGERGVWERVSQLLDADRFDVPEHATIWRAMASLHTRGVAHDVVSLAAELRAMRALNAVGGAQALGELTDDVVTTAHVEAHARLVFDASVRRTLGRMGARLAAAAADSSRDPSTLRDLAVDALQRVRVRSSAAPPDDAGTMLASMWGDIEDGIAGNGRGALRLRIDTLDRMTDGGLIRGGVYFLAARPGVGKTALACQIAASVSRGVERVLYVALEPTKRDVIRACAANVAGVDLTKITRHPEHLTQGDLDDLTTASNQIAAWPLHAVDTTAADPVDTVAGIEAAMRALPAPPSLVIVDHLLCLAPSRDQTKEHEAVSGVVTALVRLGKRTGATFLVLAHIGRAVAGKGELYRRPRTEDLAGGRTMEQVADGIILLHREDKHPTSRDSQGDPTLAGVVDILAPKLRGVRDCTAGRLRFRGEVQRFEEMAPRGSGADAPEEFDV